MSELIEVRNAITNQLADCERGAFPGSTAWNAERAALASLVAFDVAHPEVIAALRANARN